MMNRFLTTLIITLFLLLISGFTSFAYAQYEGTYGGSTYGSGSRAVTQPSSPVIESYGPGQYIPGKPDTSELVPADMAVARYFQYLNLKSLDYAYDSFSRDYKGKYSYDSYENSLGEGILYDVKAVTRNRKDAISAEVTATILIREKDGGNPRLMECKFSMIKEDQKWKIEDYDCTG